MPKPFCLDEARLKLTRGKAHLKALDEEFGRFHSSETYTVACEYDSERGQYVAQFKLLRPIPQHSWGLLLGDSVHNVRSALDYVAWRLAGSDPTDLNTLFPICSHPAKFKSLSGYRFKRIHPDVLAEIENIQPYNQPDPVHSSLWLVEELDARDKHKLITMTQAITRVHSFRGKGRVTIPYAAVEQPIEDGTVLIEFDGPPDDSVEMEFEFASHIIFERGIVGNHANTYTVTRCLEAAYKDVESVIEYFETFVSENPHVIPS